MKPFALLPLAFLAAGCVELPPDMIPQTTATPINQNTFPGLDPGGQQTTTLHFTVWAYGLEKAKGIAETCEADYNRIMQDTGLLSFRPGGTYQIVVYAGPDEFHHKTSQPDWSAGVTVGNNIYIFEGPQMAPTLAHEMTHLIFNEFMTRPRVDLRWLNEGLAVYEEMQASSQGWQNAWDGRMNMSHAAPIPFDQMTATVPADEKDRQVSQWYGQVGSVVRFVIERGGRIGFETFLTALRDGQPVDTALRAGFPAMFPDIKTLEGVWKRG